MPLVAEPDVCDARAPITLLYVCGLGEGGEELYRRLAAIADRFGETVQLEWVLPSEVPAPLDRRSLSGPTVLVLRRGQLVGEARGALLPARELDRVIRCAVEWPDG